MQELFTADPPFAVEFTDDCIELELPVSQTELMVTFQGPPPVVSLISSAKLMLYE